METQSELAYHKNLGYYWITGLNKAVFLACCAVLGGILLALVPVMFAAVELTRPKNTLADLEAQAKDAGITIFGCLVTSISIPVLFMGFMAGDWIWAVCFFSLYGGLCALLGLILGMMVLAYESVAEENYRLETEYDSLYTSA